MWYTDLFTECESLLTVQYYSMLVVNHRAGALNYYWEVFWSRYTVQSFKFKKLLKIDLFSELMLRLSTGQVYTVLSNNTIKQCSLFFCLCTLCSCFAKLLLQYTFQIDLFVLFILWLLTRKIQVLLAWATVSQPQMHKRCKISKLLAEPIILKNLNHSMSILV